jgi:hypothetical protein
VVFERNGARVVLTTLAGYSLIARDLPRSLDNVAAKPQVSRETEYYLGHIEDVKSVDDFLADRRLFGYAMKAFGLGDLTYAKALMRKVLVEGVDKPDSLANTLTDQRYREFAEAFNFARYAETTTIFDRTRQGTVDRYVRQTLEEDAGAQNEGVRLALYFARKAPEITSHYGILGDIALLKVVQTTLGISPATAALNIDKQAEMFAKRLDIDDLKDPDKVANLLNRFASLWDLSQGNSASGSPGLLFAQPLELGIGGDLLASLQNLKLGGP